MAAGTTAEERIFRQIETTADVYPPRTYADLLTYYGDIAIETDPAHGQFIPLTQVRDLRRQDGAIMFAVGVLPPAVKVTGRLLDRSASVAALDETPQPVENTTEPQTKVPDRPTATSGCGQDRTAIMQDEEFWINYVYMCQRLGIKPEELAKVINSESNWSPNAVNRGHGEAKGLHQFIKATATNRAVQMTQEDWSNYECLAGIDQLPFIEKSFGRSVRGKTAGDIYAGVAGSIDLGPDFPRGYMSKQKYYSDDLTDAQREYILNSCKKIKWKLETMFNAYEANKYVDIPPKGAKPGNFGGNSDGIMGLDDLKRKMDNAAVPFDVGKAIEKAKAAISSGAGEYTPGGGVGSDGGDGKWKQEGSDAAGKASKESEKIGDTSLNYGEKGQRYMAAQAAQIRAIQKAIENMKKTPPLRLLVNPNKFSVKGEKITSDGNWGRNGPIIEHWGDNQDTISGSGVVAGFFAMDTQNANGPGMTRYARNLSEGWQNLQSLFLLYKNNGAMYLPEILGQSKGPQNLTMLGSIYLYYDSVLYIGSFSSFTLTEEEGKPFTANYTFEFAVRAAFVLDRTDDEFDYGAPSLFRVDVPATGQATAAAQGTTNDSPQPLTVGKAVGVLDTDVIRNSSTNYYNPELGF